MPTMGIPFAFLLEVTVKAWAMIKVAQKSNTFVEHRKHYMAQYGYKVTYTSFSVDDNMIEEL